MAKRNSAAARAAQAQARELHEREARRHRRRRALIQTSIVGAAGLAVAGIVVSVVLGAQAAGEVAQPKGTPGATVASLGDAPLTIGDASVRLGAADAPVTLSLYEDFSCPHCKEYESAVGPVLDELVAAGDVAVEYHPIQFVTNYGIRAGSAATCVAEGDPERWPDVHASLFAIHDSATDGWGNDQLRDHLAGLGVSDPGVLECVADGRYEKWIDANTDVARDAGVEGTPTLMINGEIVDTLGPEELRSTVDRLRAE
ncbi:MULTISPECIES: DsbA family protein [unclassified Microbacterium]|uniref:DsbA family protein n=1 Tax=unclassified Microbacterium TaxID=2609290 RepID=UPI00386E6A3B